MDIIWKLKNTQGRNVFSIDGEDYIEDGENIQDIMYSIQESLDEHVISRIHEIEIINEDKIKQEVQDLIIKELAGSYADAYKQALEEN